ncbi:MAG TPA: CBS domain-containing protein [Methanomicrobiales archaeon]|nr:CBS domain-containing protein [Methanomicrobiales archaeon]
MKVARDIMIEVPLLSEHDHLTKARQMLRDDVFREAYVRDDTKRLVGYIDITDVLILTTTKSNVEVTAFMKDPAMVRPEDPLEKVAEEIRSRMTDSAAVVDDRGSVMGGVLLSEVFPILIARHEFKGKVSDYMSEDVIICNAEDRVQKIYNLIVDSGFTAFPVLKDKELVGVISRRDVLNAGRVRKALTGNIHVKTEKEPANTKVENLMNTPVITVTPDDSISAAARLLVKHDISRVPVVRERRVVGIMDRHDVLKGLILKSD